MWDLLSLTWVFGNEIDGVLRDKIYIWAGKKKVRITQSIDLFDSGFGVPLDIDVRGNNIRHGIVSLPTRSEIYILNLHMNMFNMSCTHHILNIFKEVTTKRGRRASIRKGCSKFFRIAGKRNQNRGQREDGKGEIWRYKKSFFFFLPTRVRKSGKFELLRTKIFPTSWK